MKLIKNVKWYVIVTGFVLFSILSVGSYAYLNDTKTTSKMQLSLKLSANQSVRLVQDKTLLEKTNIDYSKIAPLHFNENKTENEIYFYNFTGRTGKFAYKSEIVNILDNTINTDTNTSANNVAKQLKGKIYISLSSEKTTILPSWLDINNENKIKLTIKTSADFPEEYYNKPLRIGFDVELHDENRKPVQFSDGSTFMKDQWIVVQIDKPTDGTYPSDEVYEVKQALSYMYNDGKFYTITPGVVFNKDTSTLTQEQIDTLKRKYSNQTEQKIVYSNDFNIKVDNVEYVNGKGFKITYSLSETQNQTTLDAKSIQKYPTGYLHLDWIDSFRVYKGYQDVIRPVFLSSDLNLAHTNYNLLTDKTILTRSQSVDVQFLTKTKSSAQAPQLFNDTSLSSKFTVKIIGDDSSAFNTPSIVQNDKGPAIRISQKTGVLGGKRAVLQILESGTNNVVLKRELQTTSEFTPNIDAKKYNISKVVTANIDTPYNLFRYAPNSMTVKFDSNKKAYVGNLTFYFKLENHSIFTNMLPTYRFVLSTPKHMKVLSEEYSADCQWLQVNLEYSSNEDINTIKANPIDFNYRILGQISDNNSSSDLQTDSYFSYNISIFK